MKRIADGLIADGSVEHAYLGVATEDVANSTGAGIADVRAGTPAAAAGLHDGDLVTKVDGESVSRPTSSGRRSTPRAPATRSS